MNSTVFRHIPVSAFLAMAAGMYVAAVSDGPAFLGMLLLITAGSLMLVRFRGRFRAGLTSSIRHDAPAAVIVALAAASAFGAIRFESWTASLPDPAFPRLDGQRVSVLVEVSRVIRRDAVEVAAECKVAGRVVVQDGPADSVPRAPQDTGAVLVVSCRATDVIPASVGCRAIVSGSLMSVSGTVDFDQARAHPARTRITTSAASSPVSVEGPGAGSHPDPLDGFRARVVASADSTLKGHGSWLIPALVIGEGRGMPASARYSLTALGTAHVLSVSGFHVVAASAAVGVVVFLLFGIPVSRFNHSANPAFVAFCCSVLAAWGVSWLAGNPPPAVRAATMATVFVVSRLLRRRVSGLSVLAVSGITGLLATPSDVTSLSFHLSYAAMAGIAASADLAGRRPDRSAGRTIRLLYMIRSSLAVSVGASLASTPVSAAWFGSIPVAGPIANLLILPLFSFLVMPVSFAAAAVLGFAPDMSFATGPLAAVVSFGDRVADLVMEIQSVAGRFVPVSAVYPPVPVTMAVAAACASAAAALMIRGRWRWPAVVTASLLALFLPSWNFGERADIVFLDADKGDATLIRCPSGDVWLVDASVGGSGADRLVAGLRRQGVTSVTGVVLSHAHDDHFGGLPAVAEAFGPLVVSTSSHVASRLATVFPETASLRLHEVRNGRDAIPGCGLPSTVLYDGSLPCPEAGNPGSRNTIPCDDDNNRSVVFRLGTAGRDVLFAGDLEAAGERALLESGVNLRAAVLKVGHHGSRGASSMPFLKAVSPSSAVIEGWPSGAAKAPSNDVLKRYLEAGIRVHAPVVDGNVTIERLSSHPGPNCAAPVLKPQNAFPEGFRGRRRLARSVQIDVLTR